MSTVKGSDTTLSPLASAYAVGGLVALAWFGLVLVDTTDRLALVPTLIGAAGLAFRWRTGPLLFLASVAVGFTYLDAVHVRNFEGERSAAYTDLLLCAAGLCYLIAHYRLIGLTSGVFPPEPAKLADQPLPRAGAIAPRELVIWLITAAMATIAAIMLWVAISRVHTPWLTNPLHWRLGLLAWMLLIGAGLSAAVLGYLGWRRMSRTEALLFLQDSLWNETRREQRRINRWRAWALRRR
jgi:hypothetical protein